MDLKDSIKQIANNIEKLSSNIQTEEATKMSFVLPFLQALGYNVFDPTEVLPEMTCDIGTKKGEKIDYAIMRDGEAVMLIECKHHTQNLDNHSGQLLRYYGVSSAKFGVLTNGVVYRFYTDLDKANVMDEAPFLEVDLTKIKDIEIEELKKFHKSYFDINTILSSANELKYLGEFKNIISKELIDPSPEFTKFMSKQIYSGSYTAKVAEQFQTLLKRSISTFIKDTIADKLNTVIDSEKEQIEVVEQSEPVSKVITTQEEMDGYNIIRSILRSNVDASRIQYSDYQSYFVINLDGSWRWICRLYLNSKSVKYISFPKECTEGNERYKSAGEEKFKIESIDDIFGFSEQLKKSLSIYIK